MVNTRFVHVYETPPNNEITKPCDVVMASTISDRHTSCRILDVTTLFGCPKGSVSPVLLLSMALKHKLGEAVHSEYDSC